jgi:hypothetical protein
LKDIPSHIARLSNYQRVLKETLIYVKKELHNISVINRFLNLIKDRQFSDISFDQFMRTEVKIDPRRFHHLIHTDAVMSEEELRNMNCFIIMNSDN